MQKSKMAVWGGLTNSCEKKRSEKQKNSMKPREILFKKISKIGKPLARLFRKKKKGLK